MQTGSPLLVVCQIFCMLSAIKFYYNPFLKGDEVNDIFFNQLLSAKLNTFKLTVPQVSP